MLSLIDLPDDILLSIYKHLRVASIKNLQITSKSFYISIQYYIFNNCKFVLCLNDSESSKFQGFPIVKYYEYEKYINRFNTYQVNIIIDDFNLVMQWLQTEFYQSIIEKLFNRQDKSVSIKLLIHLNYSLNSFNDVKDCLVNVDKISAYFKGEPTTGNNNNVVIDLELNKVSKE